MPPTKKPRMMALNDPTFSDLTLEFSGQKRQVHKVILCSKSTWFTTALTSRFAEARSQTVVLEDDDPEILGLMLDFCYGETLEIICQRLPEKSPAALRARLFQVADKYDIPALKGDVESWFEGNEWKDSASSDKREALGLIYQMPPSTTESLRTLALKSLRLHLGFMVTKESFQSVIATQPLMAVDILSLLGRRDIGIPLAWSKCQSCDKKFAVEGPSYDKQHAKMPGPKVCPYCVTYLPEKEEVHEEYYL